MATVAPMFGTDEILWYDNGKWGDAWYALANPNGKTWTNNALRRRCPARNERRGTYVRRGATRLQRPAALR